MIQANSLIKGSCFSDVVSVSEELLLFYADIMREQTFGKVSSI